MENKIQIRSTKKGFPRVQIVMDGVDVSQFISRLDLSMEPGQLPIMRIECLLLDLDIELDSAIVEASESDNSKAIKRCLMEKGEQNAKEEKTD